MSFLAGRTRVVVWRPHAYAVAGSGRYAPVWCAWRR